MCGRSINGMSNMFPVFGFLLFNPPWILREGNMCGVSVRGREHHKNRPGCIKLRVVVERWAEPLSGTAPSIGPTFGTPGATFTPPVMQHQLSGASRTQTTAKPLSSFNHFRSCLCLFFLGREKSERGSSGRQEPNK